VNNQKREKLKLARGFLSKASDIVSSVLDDEQDCLDNMPDNLQYSDRYERMEAAISKLEDGLNNIEAAEECLEEAAE